ncbi:MAG: tRNA (guanosine(46)-N7)-methyltransferase TrmB [Chitinophagales bacterium]|nr:tRNA (guanosine(46)-N7)-methyltransferase TrmB [Chitinophagales bacterium]MCZ2392481.1 tRNA (guanosine(46)-N7)-methyltransferase TrmB [Chitinophagales bacterium]
MGKAKLVKFEAIRHMDNVFENNPEHRGKWATEHFNNHHPIVLELACGKGDYARGLAQIFPEKNFIGVDIKGNRLFTGAHLAKKQQLDNVAFIRTQIDHLDQYFEPGEVDEIWITFPDPFLKNSKHKKRLTSAKFIEVYRKFLKPNGLVNLKTDSPSLYEYTKEVIKELKLPLIKDYPDVYAMNKQASDLYGIQTYYENMHIKDNRTIHYLCFQIDVK